MSRVTNVPSLTGFQQRTDGGGGVGGAGSNSPSSENTRKDHQKCTFVTKANKKVIIKVL